MAARQSARACNLISLRGCTSRRKLARSSRRQCAHALIVYASLIAGQRLEHNYCIHLKHFQEPRLNVQQQGRQLTYLYNEFSSTLYRYHKEILIVDGFHGERCDK